MCMYVCAFCMLNYMQQKQHEELLAVCFGSARSEEATKLTFW